MYTANNISNNKHPIMTAEQHIVHNATTFNRLRDHAIDPIPLTVRALMEEEASERERGRERGWRGESVKYQSKSCTTKYNVYKPLPPIDHHTIQTSIQTQANPVGLSPLPLLCRAEKTNSAREETIYRDPAVQREHRTSTAKQIQLNRGRKVGNQAFTHSPPPSHHYRVHNCILLL